jgi:hypothetical protein
MDTTGFLQRIRQLPVLFPMVWGFHFVMLCITLFGFAADGVLDTAIAGGTVMEWLAYTLLWTFICLQNRWAAIGYIILTAINLLLYFVGPKDSVWHMISDALLPFDILMCVFLLFYYKRFH